MKILKLQAENIKKLVAVEITPDGGIVKITGKNGAGKTSVLDAILYALYGGKMPKKPIREGSDEGHIVIDLGDYIVERHFKDKEGKITTQLIVKSKDGGRYSAPQKMLDDIIGKLSFDPLEFTRLEPAKQHKTLSDLLNLDFSDIDSKRKGAYEDRTNINRQCREKQSAKNAIEYDPNGSLVEVSLSALMDEYNAAKSLVDHLDDCESEITKSNENISQLEDQIKQMQNRVAGYKQNNEALTKKLKETKRPDLANIQLQMETLEFDNKNARNAQRAAELENEINALTAKADEFTKRIVDYDGQKKKAIESAKMPIKGLDFGDGFVSYNGIPVEQISAAEQLKVSLSMAMAMNPKLRVIRVTDGSLLDSESFKQIEKLTKENDYQVWIEVVDDTGNVGICIEDGQVKK